MAEKRNYWLKLNEDYFTSPKVKKLRRVAGGDTLTIIYLKMQLLSISENGIIRFDGIEKTFEEELSLKLDEQLDDIQLLMSFLRNQELVEENGNEFLLPEACKKIGSECESAERVRVFRERKNNILLQCNEPVTEVKRSSISISNSLSNIYIDKNSKEKDIILYLNEKSGKNYRLIETNLKFVRNRLKDYTFDEIKEVIDKKVIEWKGTTMEDYLRPETLFNPTKFESYRNQSNLLSTQGKKTTVDGSGFKCY